MAKNYLCILFCVSSGQNGENLGCDEQEIINLCYILFDSKNLKTIHAFDYIIRPSSKTDFILSEECKILTGINENDLENSIYIYDAIDAFDKQLRELNISDKEFSFVTDGSLHIRQCLIPECTKKDIKLPHYYYSYYDIRKEFQKYADSRINSLGDIINSLMIDQKIEEKSHSIRQCKLIEKILLRIIQNGHNFEKADYVSKELEHGICSLDENIQMNTIVRVRGLPWQINDQDVHKFFSGLNICEGGVALCLSVQGRRNGEALVRFVNDEHRNLALRRHKHHIGQRYIEVYRASGKEFLNIIGGTNSEAKTFLSRNGKIIIRMRGLPFESNTKDVREFFENGENSCPIIDGEAGVLFVHYPDGRATGDAFVMFKDEDDTNRALLKHKAMMGQRYIELFRSTSAEVQQVFKRCQDPKYYQNNSKDIQAVPLPILPPEMITGNRKDCIRLRNLPVDCGVEQILEFLGIHSQHIVHQGCHMIFNAQGQPSGEAFIQFDGENSSYNASSHKNGKCMFFSGKKYFIEVIQCSGEEMNLVLLGLLPSNLINLQQVTSNTGSNQSFNGGNLNSNPYLLINQCATTQKINQGHQNFYYPTNLQTRQMNNSSIPTSQFFQTNPLISNSAIQNPLISSNHYSNYPPQIFYYLTPPVSPSSTVFLQQSIPGMINHHAYQQHHIHNQQFNNKINSCLLPPIELVKLVLKGALSNITSFDVTEFLKDCGEILPDFIQIQNTDEYSADVYITCERSMAERIYQEKNHQKLGNSLIEIYFTI